MRLSKMDCRFVCRCLSLRGFRSHADFDSHRFLRTTTGTASASGSVTSAPHLRSFGNCCGMDCSSSLELLGAATVSLWWTVVGRYAVRSDRSFPGFQLAATAAHHVSLR